MASFHRASERSPTPAATTCRFVHYQLRTIDVAAARDFYTTLLGDDFLETGISIAALPERARARGAPPHWLGHLRTPEVAAAARRMVADGGQLLGPPSPALDDSMTVVLRDPFGAVLALTPDGAVPERDPVAWHLLHARDEGAAFSLYAELFDWEAAGMMDLGDDLGRHRLFGWGDTERTVGSIANTARPPAIHPQWLFYFPVDDLEAALAVVRERGGLVVDPIELSTGERVAACDDPHGAAFGLRQDPR